MKAVLLLISCVLVALTTPASSARILCMFGFSSKSHNNVFSALTSELASRGHDVTVVTPYPIKTTTGKYRQIDVPEIHDVIENIDQFSFSKNYISQFISSWDMINSCSKVLQMPELKQLLHEKFDLVINSIIFNECTMGFAYHNNAPLILISPSASLMWNTETMGNPEPSSYVPSIVLPFADHMNFLQRALNMFVANFIHVMRIFVHVPRMNSAAREFFGENIPSVAELEKNASLAILNNHVSLNYPRPLLPNIIEVGGMHNKKNLETLPKDIKEFLDGSTEGAVYFSLGSIVRSDSLPPEIIQIIIEVLRELPQRVLWKWNSDTLPDKPSNVKLGKWFPQQEILAHPNTRLFITQGGLMSTQEAVYHGVPLVGIPVLGDQRLNMKRNELLGFAITIDLTNFSKEAFKEAIYNVLHTPSYSETAKILKKRVRDQPQPPLDRAVFWTEYVLRHNGAPHLRSAATHLAWYQLYLLDVAVVILGGFLLTVFILRLLVRAIRKQFCNYKKSTPVKQRKLKKK